LPTNIGVAFGGPSPEHDISILTGLQAARALARAGRAVTCLYWAKDATWWRVPVDTEAAAFLDPDSQREAVEFAIPGGFTTRGRLGRVTPVALDTVLNCCHGGPGEDGALTAALTLAGLRPSGPSPEACALAMDKLGTTALAASLGVAVIDTVLWRPGIDLDELPPPPWVAKPRYGGSSLGIEADISDTDTLADLARRGVASAGLLIQPYLNGWADLNIAVRGYPSFAVSPIERPIRAEANPLYGYDDKYLRGEGMESAPRELPADLPDAVAQRVRDAATTVSRLWGPTGAARVDFLWDGADDVRLCEVNAIPGSWGAYLWAAAGVGRETLLGDLIDEALAAPLSRPQWAATSTGSALRAAGTITSKLS
jgi:D-alanine-D-alanine ligase